MKQKQFTLHDHISPLKMWADRYTQMIREAASEKDVSDSVRQSLHKLAEDIDTRTNAAWVEIENVAKKMLQQSLNSN